jgi:hypothetical protein
MEVMVTRTCLFAVFLTAAFATSSAAQELTDSFADVPGLKPGAIVFVTDDQGRRTKGKITNLSAASLELVTRGRDERPVVFQSDRVVRVTRIDSRWNGFLIGAAIGAVPGIILGSLFNEYCYNESGGHCPIMILFAGTATGLAGGWIGFGIDGAINAQTPIYTRPPRPPGLALSFRF